MRVRGIPSSKVTVPAASHPVLGRPALVKMLDAAGPLTAVVAPAGYGKTWLPAQWVAATPELPTAWVVDEIPIKAIAGQGLITVI